MSPKPPTTVRGRVVRITFHNPDNGYSVAKLEVPGEPGLVTVVGAMPGITEGLEVEVSGRAVVHPKFGPQVEVESFKQHQPSDAQGCGVTWPAG